MDLDGDCGRGRGRGRGHGERKLCYVNTHFDASLMDVFLAALPLYPATPGVDDTNRPCLRPSLQNTWQANLSAILSNLLNLGHTPLYLTGCSLEAFLNFIHRHLFSPSKDPPYAYSLIGWLDPRLDLLITKSDQGSLTIPRRPKQHGVVTKDFLDLAIMASKLAYESEEVQRYGVTERWKMWYYKFYDCYNDLADANTNTTQAFVFTDKPNDASIIFLAFRGTEPFNTIDWCTDFNFAFLEFCDWEGGLHMGFLEALGLVNRKDKRTMKKLQQNVLNKTQHASGINTFEVQAYDAITQDIDALLQANPNAKFYVSGHSLGGALALTFASMLILMRSKGDTILEKLSGVYTFGQPRICNGKFSDTLNNKMQELNVDYYRIVYCNDMVCRVPFDDDVFKFKHAGHKCFYYNSMFEEKDLEEAPNKNFFSPLYVIPMWLNAIWELVRGQIGHFIYGKDFNEGTLSILHRIMGVLLPGVSAHIPTDYVNAIRLGPKELYNERCGARYMSKSGKYEMANG